jgi:hypothetical protein
LFVQVLGLISPGKLNMPDPLKWYEETADNPAWIKALAEVRRLAPREGYCYQHVQAIIVSIDQYAEKALENREFLFEQTLWGRPKG